MAVEHTRNRTQKPVSCQHASHTIIWGLEKGIAHYLHHLKHLWVL